MRILSILALTSALTAQSLTTTFAAGNGQQGNMFDIVGVQGVSINGFDLNLAPGTYNIEVYTVTAGTSFIGNETNAAAWTLAGTATGVVSAGTGLPTPLPISLNVPIAPGQTQGFYVTMTGTGTMWYTNGSSLGSVYVQDNFIQFLEGVGKSYPFGATFTPRIWNGTIYYTATGGGTFATNTSVGAGCGGSTLADGSVYELFASGFDLANTSHTYAWVGGGYILLPGASTGFVTPAGTGVVTLGDDTLSTVSLPFNLPSPQGFRNSVVLCSNGYLWFRANTVADFTETVAELLSQDSRLCFLWDDLNPGAGGQVTAEPDAVNPGAFHITFTNVPEFGGTNQNTVQVTLLASGDIEVKYGAVALQDCLVGLSSGNGATDPGTSDYSNLPTAPIGPFLTGQNIPALSLAAATRPVLGTNWNLNTTNALPGAAFGLTILGLSDPAIPDLAFLGMPGCQLRATLDVLDGPWLITSGSGAYSFAVPATPTSLVGIELFAQSVVFGGGANAFDAVTSNAVKGTLGDI